MVCPGTRPTRSSPTPLRHRAPARLLRPYHPTTNANNETAHPAGPGETASTGPAPDRTADHRNNQPNQSSTHPPDAARGHLRPQRPQTGSPHRVCDRAFAAAVAQRFLICVVRCAQQSHTLAFREPTLTSPLRHPTAREPAPPSLTGCGKSPLLTRRHKVVRAKPTTSSTSLVRRIESIQSHSDPHRGKGTRTHPTRPKKFLMERNITDFAPLQPPTTATNTTHPSVAFSPSSTPPYQEPAGQKPQIATGLAECVASSVTIGRCAAGCSPKHVRLQQAPRRSRAVHRPLLSSGRLRVYRSPTASAAPARRAHCGHSHR